jgi:hypothetical protein
MTALTLGTVLATPGALRALEDAGASAEEFLERHLLGDWGEVSCEDWLENERSIAQGLRILSRYTVAPDVRIWIITEADRSATTILLPEEY